MCHVFTCFSNYLHEFLKFSISCCQARIQFVLSLIYAFLWHTDHLVLLSGLPIRDMQILLGYCCSGMQIKGGKTKMVSFLELFLASCSLCSMLLLYNVPCCFVGETEHLFSWLTCASYVYSQFDIYTSSIYFSALV